MPLKKYVEIEWKEIRFTKTFSQQELILNAAVDYSSPTNTSPSEKILFGLAPPEANIFYPKSDLDKILFTGYLEDSLSLGVSLFPLEQGQKSDRKTFFSNPEINFSFFGFAPIVFSGLLPFIEQENMLAHTLLCFKHNTEIPLHQPKSYLLYLADKPVGEIYLSFYIRPQGEDIFFYNDVAIFPLSEQEIVVYYMGDLSASEQVYILWTLDDWKSNPLIKMKRYQLGWTAVLELPSSVPLSAELILAFTDSKHQWDNKDGNNWLFRNFLWR